MCRDARMPSFFSFLPGPDAAVVLVDDEAGLAAVAELGVDGRDDDVDVGVLHRS